MLNLFYRESGVGPPLLILHGLFGSSDNWASLAKKLAENYHVFLIDQRNHGQSPHTNEWNYSLMAQDIEDFCIQRKLSNVFIVGHSMGGKTLMRLAELYPERIHKMMVIDIAPRYYPVHHQVILNALNLVNLNEISSRTQVDEVIKSYIPDVGTRQFLLKNLFWNSSNKLAWRFNLKIITQYIEAVGEATPQNISTTCSIPTLFIKGQNSDYINAADLEQIKKSYLQAVIKTIPHAGHWIHADNPVALWQAMRDFF